MVIVLEEKREEQGKTMADAVVIPQVQPVQPVLRFRRIVLGVLFLAAIGYSGELLEQNVGAYAKAHHRVFPNIEYVLWAILLGLLLSNTIGVPEIFRSGVATYEFWLTAGIVLLGSRFFVKRYSKAGWRQSSAGGHRDHRRDCLHDISWPRVPS